MRFWWAFGWTLSWQMMKLPKTEDELKNNLHQIVGVLVISLIMVSCKNKEEGRGGTPSLNAQ
jgi:hypothetical protein